MEKRHPIRIVIADDHPIFRDGLRRLLESEGDMKVVGEACDGHEAVKLATEIKPDILLLDLAMPHHTGLDALRDLNASGGAGGGGAHHPAHGGGGEEADRRGACNWERAAW